MSTSRTIALNELFEGWNIVTSPVNKSGWHFSRLCLGRLSFNLSFVATIALKQCCTSAGSCRRYWSWGLVAIPRKTELRWCVVVSPIRNSSQSGVACSCNCFNSSFILSVMTYCWSPNHVRVLSLESSCLIFRGDVIARSSTPTACSIAPTLALSTAANFFALRTAMSWSASPFWLTSLVCLWIYVPF